MIDARIRGSQLSRLWLLSTIVGSHVGCSVAIDLPPLLEEESSEACENDEDDDLDGEMNCADPGCAVFCPDGDTVLPPSFECFSDSTRGLAFRRVGVDPVHCEPYPERELDCAGDEHLLPGAEGCRLVGVACPAEWPTSTEEVGVIYVRSGSVEGDGSRARPFGSLTEALAASVDGDTIEVGPGDYEGAHVDVDVTIRGACASQTRLAGLASGALFTLENLTVIGELVVTPTGQLHAIGIAVRGRTSVEGEATFDGARFVSNDVGITVTGNATVLASTIEAAETGILAQGPIEVRGVAVRGTRATAIDAEAEAVLEGVAITVVDGVGFSTRCVASSAGSCATVSRSHFDAIQSAESRSVGLDLRGPTTVTGTRVLGMRSSGIEARSTVSSTHLAIENCGGYGVWAHPSSTVTLSRGLLRANADSALRVEIDATLTAIEVSITGPVTGTSQHCVVAAGTLQMTSFEITSCPQCGLVIEDTSTVVVTNGIITETTDGACVARRADISMPALTRSVTYRNNVTNVARYDR
jgi:hypothetical protein